MPAKSQSQRKFFYLVKALQEGKVSPKSVGSKISKAASKITPQSVNNFIGSSKLPKDKLEEMVGLIKELIEPMNLETRDSDDMNEDSGFSDERNPIAKTFQQKGNFEEYIQKFSGLEIKPKELESIANYVDSKPTKQDKFSIRYESQDEFANNTITVIKKLREGNDLVFTVFQDNSSQSDVAGGETNTSNDIVVTKSVSFKDEIEGGQVLADLLSKLEI